MADLDLEALEELMKVLRNLFIFIARRESNNLL